VAGAEVRIVLPDGERRLSIPDQDEQNRQRLVDRFLVGHPGTGQPDSGPEPEPEPEPELPAKLDTDPDALGNDLERPIGTSSHDADTDRDAFGDTGDIPAFHDPFEDPVEERAEMHDSVVGRDLSDPHPNHDAIPSVGHEPEHDFRADGPVVAGSGSMRSPRVVRPQSQVSLDDAVRKALGLEVHLGALGLNVPALRHGREDIVKVVVARGADSTTVVTAFVAQSQVASVEPIQTSAVMHVGLTGPRFGIRRLNPPDGEQLVSDTAVWEFEVTPLAAGKQTLTVSASMRLPVAGLGQKTVSIPSLRQDFYVEVNRLYASRVFLHKNWQWVGTSGIAVGAVVVALSKK
jgi:hypothetical protein